MGETGEDSNQTGCVISTRPQCGGRRLDTVIKKVREEVSEW